MATSDTIIYNTKGFYVMFKKGTKAKPHDHIFYYLEDIIRNEFSLHEQEIKKEKWRVYCRVLESMNAFDKDYSPLADAKTITNKINKLITFFANIFGHIE